MAIVHLSQHLDDLARDARADAVDTKPKMVEVVARNVEQGTEVMKRIAGAKVGRHGTAYPKRVSGEVTGELTGEFGPHAGGTPVGAGFRHGVNTDTAQAADEQGPKFADDAGDLLDHLKIAGH